MIVNKDIAASRYKETAQPGLHYYHRESVRPSVRPSTVSENAYNSLTASLLNAWIILFKLCILIYFNIVQPKRCMSLASGARPFIPLSTVSEKRLLTLEPHVIFL